MARLTRQELKKDEFLTTVEAFEDFARRRYREIIGVAVAVLVIGGATVAFKVHAEHQEDAANAALGAALKTFAAPVGNSAPDLLGGGASTSSFASAQDKYKKALEEFNQIIVSYPRRSAGEIARYHAGLCEAELGNQAAAVKVLQDAADASNANLAALAQLALAGEYMKSGKTEDATKLYRHLADHPTSTVPKETAQLALADAYRSTQPGQARAIYEQLQNESGSNSYLAETVKEDLATLPK